MISIIVPVYNGEKYLERCLKSIQNQTYENFEVIIINDGSTDNSEAICQDFVDNDYRYKLINQENSGAGTARNVGISFATGNYIGFVDCDDFIHEKMFEILSNSLIENDCDISIIKLGNYYSGEPHISRINTKCFEIELLDRREAIKELIKGKKFGTHSATKLIKREVLDDLSYPKSSYAEDSKFMLEVFFKASKFVYCDIELYFYMHNDQSSNGSFFNPTKFSVIDVWRENERKITSSYPELFSLAHSRLCWAYFSVLDMMILSKVENNYSETASIISFLKKNFLFVMKTDNLTLGRKIAMVSLLLNVNLYKMIVNTFINRRN